ncbi:MAG: glutamine--tRNA ligase/YqeY domain fusion protein [Thermoplasmatota archaeon]
MAGEGESAERASDFIRDIINEHNRTGRFGGRVHTRFPPEPNGYLHIGHAKSICLNFGIAEEYGGLCNLRFDDTNPAKEEQEFVDAIVEDVRWLGFDWGDRIFFASDYFERMHELATQLIRAGKAYVDDLSADEISRTRGSLTEPGTPSPHRDRSVEENLDLFERMRRGEFESGARVLRAKIDMAHPNMNMRDPVMYRILKVPHHRQGAKWCIYPTYDWAHGLEDSIEGITHSICTLEFEDHRPLYDWFLDQLGVHHPQQIEFARLNLSYTVMSKRMLRQLVEEGRVSGWDDPRLPTISGMRRRGFSPAGIRLFCRRIGVSKVNSIVDIGFLEHCIREDLNKSSPRYMGVLRPLRVVLENYPEGRVEEVEVMVNPENPSAGVRRVPLSRVIYIEQEDFMEEPPKEFFRLSPGREVRLRGAYLVTCREAVKEGGEVVELRCALDLTSRGGRPSDGRKVKATIHWVSAAHAIEAEVRLYDRLFTVEDPAGQESRDFREFLNPHSLEVLKGCRMEPAVGLLKPLDRIQLERLGYFCVDPDSRPGRVVLNLTVRLRDGWSRARQSANL